MWAALLDCRIITKVTHRDVTKFAFEFDNLLDKELTVILTS